MWGTIFFYGFFAFMIYGFYLLCEEPHHKKMFKFALFIIIVIGLIESGTSLDCRHIGFLDLC